MKFWSVQQWPGRNSYFHPSILILLFYTTFPLKAFSMHFLDNNPLTILEYWDDSDHACLPFN